MDRILKPMPLDLRGTMEALVHDLSVALEESSSGATVRRRWGIRRRARSTGNIPSMIGYKQSEDRSDSSSICDANSKQIEVASVPLKYQSDSDDTNHSKRFANFSKFNIISNIESDSVNENFVPRIATRRKRKFKKMAIDSDSNPSTSQALTIVTSTVGKKKRVFRNDCENRYKAIWCGKRKRSCRERSTDCEMRSSKPNRSIKIKNKNKVQGEDAMDCSHLSSSSISSSDSEDGLITNDEDREGDDEQSDWIGESSWWDDRDSMNDDKPSTSSVFQTMLTDHVIDENKKRRLQYFRDGINGREILAGRRHVDNTPGYSIVTSANEKVSRFLQDPSQSELRLHPIRQFEREKLRRLANLYSLNLKGDLSCPILYKTKRTTQAICVDQVSLHRLSDYKRLRKTPPNSPNPDSEMTSHYSPDFTPMNNPTFQSQNVELVKTEDISSFSWSRANKISNEVQVKPKFHFSNSKSS